MLGGDYNMISRNHRPLHPGFLPFEFELLETLQKHGFIDTYHRHAPGDQAYSWIGRTGDGYRYDYLHAGPALADRILSCEYLHQTREQRLTDHAVVTAVLRADARHLNTTDPAETALF